MASNNTACFDSTTSRTSAKEDFYENRMNAKEL
jgi:hypothetical protein